MSKTKLPLLKFARLPHLLIGDIEELENFGREFAESVPVRAPGSSLFGKMKPANSVLPLKDLGDEQVAVPNLDKGGHSLERFQDAEVHDFGLVG